MPEKPNVKIRFSPEELRFIRDDHFLLTKRKITKKVYELFWEVAENIKQSKIHQDFQFPAGTDFSSGKISRGENYNGLPYVMLDLPRLFEQGNIFAFRTMFWWGKYFVFTFHLSGTTLKHYRNRLLKNWPKLDPERTYLCINDSEWAHEIEEHNYKLLGDLTTRQVKAMIREHPFIKLAVRRELATYESLPEWCVESYEMFLDNLSN